MPDLPVLCRQVHAWHRFRRIPFNLFRVEQALLPLLRTPDLGRVWLIETVTGVAGYIVLCFGWSGAAGGRVASIDQFYVEDDRRRRGLGSRALQAVLVEARNMKLKAVNVVLREEDAAVRGLFLSCGFAAAPEPAVLSFALQG